MITQLDELDRINRRITLAMELKRLNAKRLELHQELLMLAAHDRLKFYCEAFRATRPSYDFYWQEPQPERWPWGAKLREPRVAAHAWMARSAVDTHIKRFTIYEDGMILCEAGYLIPLDLADFVAMLVAPDSASQAKFDQLARRVFGIEEPKPGIPPEPLPHRPWSDDALIEITQFYLRDLGRDPGYVVEPTKA